VPVQILGMATNTKKVGDGITARTIRLKDVEDFSLDEWADLKSTLVSLPEVYQSAWGPNAPLIANIREWLVEVRSKAPEPSDHRALAEYFAYRETEAWFVLTIAKFARHIERCVEQKKSWEAVSFALDLGMLVAELAYKHDIERAALRGASLLETQGQSAKARRKQPAEERIAFVEQKKAMGKSVRQAFSIAAKHFGVSAATIKKDYYNKRST
jgi:hypothetical protein